MKQINVYQAKTQLSQLIEEALSGKEIIIARNGDPLVMLVPYTRTKKRRFGALKGKIRISSDINAPLPEEIIKDFES